jgi:hypothetical protein
MAEPITFSRPSRSGGPDHVVSVSADTLRPIRCPCRAGQLGHVCWASLEVALDPDLLSLALERWAAAQGVTQLTAAAKLYGAVVRRRGKAAAELVRREHLGADPDGRWLLTDAGRDALARATAEAWLFGTGPSVAEVSALGAAA